MHSRRGIHDASRSRLSTLVDSCPLTKLNTDVTLVSVRDYTRLYQHGCEVPASSSSSCFEGELHSAPTVVAPSIYNVSSLDKPQDEKLQSNDSPQVYKEWATGPVPHTPILLPRASIWTSLIPSPQNSVTANTRGRLAAPIVDERGTVCTTLQPSR